MPRNSKSRKGPGPKSQSKSPGRSRSSGTRARAHAVARNSNQSERGGERGRSGGGRTAGRPRGAQPKLIGTVQKHPRGFAFLVRADNKGPDIFVPPEEAAGLLTRDKVEFTVQQRGARSSAKILAVVSRGTKEIIGRLNQDRHRWWVTTEEGDSFLVSENSNNQREEAGDWVIGKITDYPSPDGPGKIAIEDVLGGELLPKHDLPITIAKFSLPTEFQPRTINATESLRELAEREVLENRNRADLRKLPFVTIDGPTAKDFDDAILVLPGKGQTAYRLFVAIADVSFFVREGTSLDDEARDRSTSVYFPGVCIPMLPESLSNDLCSLRPKEDKLAMVAEIHYDRLGNTVETSFYEAVICTFARLTYDEAERIALKSLQPSDPQVGNSLKMAFDLYRKLWALREKRGALDFDLPESEIEVDDQGNPTRIAPAGRLDSHRVIEEFMIAANRVVGRSLREEKIPTLYRVHEAPDPAKLEELNALLRSLGINHRMPDLKPTTLSRLLSDTKGVKGAKTLHQAILRLQKQARYSPEPKGHFGLSLKDYLHFTSPIRRYPDLVVHRSLRTLIGSDKKTEKRRREENLEEMGNITSDRERRAMEAERFLKRRKQCWYFVDKVGQTFSGRISGLIPKGIFVEMSDTLTEGFLSLEKLNESLSVQYEFDEVRHCLRRRPGHTTLSVGDELKVRVEDVRVEAGEIELDVVEI